MNPTKIREYEIIAGPFSGSYGSVWIGRHGVLKWARALKHLHSHVQQDVIKQEATKLMQVKSPHVVQVYDFFTAEPLGDFLVMEYCPVGLDQHLRQRFAQTGGKLPYNEAREILEGVLRGLNDAHSADIVHGDIKPANVRFGVGATDQQLGLPKLSDFGAARHLRQAEPGIRGSTNWMAPELLAGTDATRLSDYFSYGILAYLVLSGRHPFFADDVSCLTSEEDNIANASFLPQALTSLRSDINPIVGEHVMVLLSRDPDLRQKSAQTLIAALAQPWSPPSPTPPAVQAPPSPIPGLTPEQLSELNAQYEHAKYSFFVAFDPRQAVDTLDSLLLEADWKQFVGKKIVVIADSWSLMGYIKNSWLLYDEAIEAATNGLTVHPDHVSALHVRGYALVHQSRYDEAKKDLERALAISTDPSKQRQISQLLHTIRAR
jgi:serine/threonine protein kinase